MRWRLPRLWMRFARMLKGMSGRHSRRVSRVDMAGEEEVVEGAAVVVADMITVMEDVEVVEGGMIITAIIVVVAGAMIIIVVDVEVVMITIVVDVEAVIIVVEVDILRVIDPARRLPGLLLWLTRSCRPQQQEDDLVVEVVDK